MHGEASGAGEHIEHAGALAHRGQQRPVLPLVEEVPGLLAADHVGLEQQPVLEERHRLDGQVTHHGHRPAADAATMAHDHGRRNDQLTETVDDVRKVGQPGRGVDLRHVRVVVAIDHEAGQAVVLPVDEAIPGGVAGLLQRPPVRQRGAQSPGPERRVDRRRPAVVQDTDADRRVRVVQADGDERPVRIEDDRQVARGPVVADGRDRPVEHPRMPGPDLALGVAGDAHRHPAARLGQTGAAVEACSRP